MNKSGFTLVEIISVIVLLGIIALITTTMVLNSSNNAKKGLLDSKIAAIENAAVLYGQDHRGNFGSDCNGVNEPCYGIVDKCSCFKSEVDVAFLITNKILEPDQDSDTIKNPVNDEDMKGCKVQLYTKYGKIYAIFDKNQGVKCHYSS